MKKTLSIGKIIRMIIHAITGFFRIQTNAVVVPQYNRVNTYMFRRFLARRKLR
jgi:hypothetical protein